MFTTRPMEQRDAEACTDIVNFIIRKGGTTAYEDEYSIADFDGHYRGKAKICNVIVSAGRVVGFQGLFDVGDGVLSIGSFTDQRDPVKGAGRALIDASKKAAKDMGYTSIIAKITEDNVSGLGYYSNVGFVDDYIIRKDHQRSDGTWVDRIVKRLVL